MRCQAASAHVEELFEVFSWRLLGLHDKPVALLDPDGFYDPLVDQLDRSVAQGYLSVDKRAALGRVRTVDELLASYDAQSLTDHSLNVAVQPCQRPGR